MMRTPRMNVGVQGTSPVILRLHRLILSHEAHQPRKDEMTMCRARDQLMAA